MPIAQGIATLANFSWAAFSIAGNSLAYRAGSGLSITQLEWRDRKGNRVGTIGGPADYTNPVFSPDGRTLAVSVRDPDTRTRDLWLFDIAHAAPMGGGFDVRSGGRHVGSVFARWPTHHVYIKSKGTARHLAERRQRRP